jgi:hypothetical protein
MKLPASLTTVTPFSKTLALLLFILLPFVGFWLGFNCRQSSSVFPDTLTTKSLPTSSLPSLTSAPQVTQADNLPVTSVPQNWATTVENLYVSGLSEKEVSNYRQLTISLPPELKYESTGSEEFLYSTKDRSIVWDIYSLNFSGSRREGFGRYLEYKGGNNIDGKPTSSCTVVVNKEVAVAGSQTYLDVTAKCQEARSNGTVNKYSQEAYLYQLSGKIVVIGKSGNKSKNSVIEPYLKTIFSSMKL